MRGVPLPSLADSGNDAAQDAYAPGEVVLGHLDGGAGQGGHLCHALVQAAGTGLSHGLDHAAQAPQAMGQRDAGYTLTGSIEMDDAYFGGAAAGKRGRGSPNKTPVAVMVEYRGEHAGFLAIKTLSTVNKQQIDAPSAKIGPGQEHTHRRVERLQ